VSRAEENAPNNPHSWVAQGFIYYLGKAEEARLEL